MSSYSELIKNFEKIRAYMRDFYVYGFKSRDDYQSKSARSYDDERRRLESWLGDHMSFVRTPEGKNVFISIDSRTIRHNPLYNAWKAKSLPMAISRCISSSLTFSMIRLSSVRFPSCLRRLTRNICRALNAL